ncbi:hypothetical protein HanIR_Chr16g0788761 [Helianthus annuus]|nr:hypothetical protein HanIR_Chr16g0788761 [Helianthus annuus]
MLITITFSVFSGELGCVCNVSFESDCSFDTDQSRVSLYMTAVVSPKTGLGVTLSGSAASGSPPTTSSPTLLNIDCRFTKSSITIF